MQTWAILIDAYRELNARKMFWISLGISLLVVCVFAGLGINEKGIELLWFTVEIGPLTTALMSRSLFYKTLFMSVGLTIWLGWASTILALVSTASIIPDFVSSGSIEGMLARPISRSRLFLTKYFASLLFVVLQAIVFSAASILVIGVRGGVWLWGLMLAVPIITLFFSYLYCVSALVGVWTRSTLASLLASLAVWGVVLAMGVAENGLLIAKISAENPIPLIEKDVEARELQVRKAKESSTDPADFAKLEKRLEERREDLITQREKVASIDTWYRIAFTAKTILPKTGDTKELLERAVINDREMEQMANMADDRDNRRGGGPFGASDMKAVRQAEKINKSRSLWWVIGTSVLFEAFIVAWACRIFARRDF